MESGLSVEEYVRELGMRAKRASYVLAGLSTEEKNTGLRACAAALRDRRADILSANEDDLTAADEQGLLEGPARDRLQLNEARLEGMATGLEDVASLPDPVGEWGDSQTRPNGLVVRQLRVPLGVVGVIYENRPNVTSDAAGICMKSGNAALLRGSTTALRSNSAVMRVLHEGLASTSVPQDAMVLIDDVSRDAARAFMQLNGIMDCLIPRGGTALLDAIARDATVPYIIDGSGNCHIYVDESVDVDEAVRIIVNAKTQRPGVCNAAESLVVHAALAPLLLSRLAVAMDNVELRGDERACEIVPSMTRATDIDYATEFLGSVLSVRVVDDLDDAIAHIRAYSTGHTEAILATNEVAIDRFVRNVDAAAVVVNCSTRFVDGGELGLGAEIGISTQKLHCRGPMGLRELTCLKYVVTGSGQVRS